MHSYSMDLGGRTLTIEAGKIAKQANGGVLVRYGDTAVVVAVTGTKTPREGVDFFPLTVDFEEKMYAVGKIPGGFIKREGRPSEQAILTSRLIDRPIRPMFPEGYHNDVQIVATAVSVDPDNAPDIAADLFDALACMAAFPQTDEPQSGESFIAKNIKFFVRNLVKSVYRAFIFLAELVEPHEHGLCHEDDFWHPVAVGRKALVFLHEIFVRVRSHVG